MKRFRALGVSFILACLTGASAAAQEPNAPAEVQAGRAVALKTCAACHDVSAGRQMEPLMNPPAPSFRAIANQRGTTAKSLLAFLATKHRSVANYREMPGLKTTDEEFRAVVAYVLSLREPTQPH